MEEEVNLEGMADFDLADATYEIWILGYNENYEAVDFEVCHSSHKTSEEAEQIAAQLYDTPLLMPATMAKVREREDVKYIAIQVETVVDVDGEATNVETLYNRIIEVK